MKKIIAILMVAVMAVSFFACSSSKDKENAIKKTTTEKVMTDEEKLIGEWIGEISFVEMMYAGGNEPDDQNRELLGLDDLDDTIYVNAEFKEDGTYFFSIDEDSINDLIDRLIENLKVGVCKMLRESNEAYADYTDEELLKLYEQMSGSSIEDAMKESVNMDELREQLDNSGSYTFKDGKLYTNDDENPSQIKFDGNNKMTMTEKVMTIEFERN